MRRVFQVQQGTVLESPALIHNIGKSGSHFLTQTLTNLVFPVAFEYGLRLNKTTQEKTELANTWYKEGTFSGFSGAG